MGRTLFINVQILDRTGAKPHADEVLVEGNRIKEVAKAGKKLAADGAQVVDGGGAALMPGLIESHGHISFWYFHLHARPVISPNTSNIIGQ